MKVTYLLKANLVRIPDPDDFKNLTAGTCLSKVTSTLCLKKTSPTFLAVTRESIDGFFYNIWQKCY